MILDAVFQEVNHTLNADFGTVFISGGNSPDLNGCIRLWQPNTEYKVEDVVIVNFENKDLFDPNDEFLYRTIIAKCVRPHKSESFFLLNNNELEEAWVILQETYAYYDALGRRIHNTYATKEEVGNIETALDNIIAIQNQLIGGDT